MTGCCQVPARRSPQPGRSSAVGLDRLPAARRDVPVRRAGPCNSARRDLALELDGDLVLDLQRAHHRGELLDAEVLLAQREAARDLAVADLQRDADRAALAGDREIALGAAVLDGGRREGDLRASEGLPGDALLDVALVLVGQGLRAARAFDDLERAGVRGVRDRRAVAALDGRLPAVDADDEVVAHLRGRALLTGLDLQRSVAGSDLVRTCLNWHNPDRTRHSLRNASTCHHAPPWAGAGTRSRSPRVPAASTS